MKKLLLVAVLFIGTIANAQTVDEILSTYYENIGGIENLKKITGVKMVAKINQQGMEIPLEIYQLSDGKQMTIINFQGRTDR